MSAKTGEGLDALRAAVRKMIGGMEAPADAGLPAHVAVDRSFAIQGTGTVVTGTLVRGVLDAGARVSVVRPDGASSSSSGAHLRAALRYQWKTHVAVDAAMAILADLDARFPKGRRAGGKGGTFWLGSTEFDGRIHWILWLALFSWGIPREDGESLF